MTLDSLVRFPKIMYLPYHTIALIAHHHLFYGTHSAQLERDLTEMLIHIMWIDTYFSVLANLCEYLFA